jgi:hypothetical protein
LPSLGIEASVVAVAPTYDDAGYYVLTAGNRVYAFGNAMLPRAQGPGGTTVAGGAVAIVGYRSK